MIPMISSLGFPPSSPASARPARPESEPALPTESFTAGGPPTKAPVPAVFRATDPALPVEASAQDAPPAPGLPAVPTRLSESEPLSAPLSGHLQAVSRHLAAAETPANPYFVDERMVSGLPWKSILSADAFTMSLSGPKAEDSLLACGAALAKGVPSLYVVQERKQLPWFLQQADQTYPGLVAVLEGKRDQVVAEQGAQALASLRPQPLPSYPFPQPQVDTFIGCLMSGLTKEQYAEGRGHLQAINESLGKHLDSPGNYCEGINVGNVGDFGTPRESLGNDLEAVRRARHCVFYTYDQQPRPSGMWIELGAAMAWDKPCTVLVPDKKCLPPALQSGPLPDNLRIVEYGDHQALLGRLADPQAARELLIQHSR